MYGNILVAIATVAALAEIAIFVLIRTPVWGYDESAFMRFGRYGGGAATLAIVTALAAITLALVRRSDLTATVLTVVLCVLTVGVFLRVLIWGAGG